MNYYIKTTLKDKNGLYKVESETIDYEYELLWRMLKTYYPNAKHANITVDAIANGGALSTVYRSLKIEVWGVLV